MDPVGGVAKIAISRGQLFFNAEDCVSYLSDKFNSQENPSYRIKPIEHNTYTFKVHYVPDSRRFCCI